MDQASATDWVQANIAAIGGDPDNVTIFGESADSISVSAQMASPLSKNPVKRAIGESGSVFMIVAPTLSISPQFGCSPSGEGTGFAGRGATVQV